MNKIVHRSRRRFRRKIEKAFRSMAVSMGIPFSIINPPKMAKAFEHATYRSSLGRMSLCFTCSVVECPLRGNRFGIHRCDEHLPFGNTFIDPETRKALYAISRAYLR